MYFVIIVGIFVAYAPNAETFNIEQFYFNLRYIAVFFIGTMLADMETVEDEDYRIINKIR